MKPSTLNRLIELASRILYTVVSKRTSLDRAFQEVVKGVGRKSYSKVPHAILYRVCRGVVRDYHTMKFVSREVLGRRPTMRFVVRLWIALRGNEVLDDDAIVARVRKELGVEDLDIESVIESFEDPVLRLSLRYSFPKWFVNELVTYLGFEECERLLKALNQEILWIRVNTLKCDVDKILRVLDERGVVVEVDKELPYMLRVIEYESPVQYVDLVNKCEVVLQDKASALVVEELGVECSDEVLELGAAPGVKTSLIEQLGGNKVKVVAIDVSRERVARMKKFLKCMGVDLDRVHVVIADAARIGFAKRFPKALVDAPCTGSGTVPRDPAIKIHLEDREWLRELTATQLSMLRSAIEYAREIVYATCSVLPHEGERIVERFRDYVVRTRVRGLNGVGELGSYVARFYPHVHGTHGFFIARLEVRNR